MNYIYIFLGLAFFLILLEKNMFLHTEELFIGLVSLTFFLIIFFFLRKIINNYFFYRYDLVYTVFFFLLSLTNIYFNILNNLIIWLSLRLYVFDSYLIRISDIFLAYINGLGLKSNNYFGSIYLEVFKTKNLSQMVSRGSSIEKNLNKYV